MAELKAIWEGIVELDSCGHTQNQEIEMAAFYASWTKDMKPLRIRLWVEVVGPGDEE